MPNRADLQRMPIKQLHDLAIDHAREHDDVGFLWDLVKALPAAEATVGDIDRSAADIMHPLALINDLLYETDDGALGESLRPMYVDYLADDPR